MFGNNFLEQMFGNKCLGTNVGEPNVRKQMFGKQMFCNKCLGANVRQQMFGNKCSGTNVWEPKVREPIGHQTGTKQEPIVTTGIQA